jgi:phosphoglycerol transferase MdoB-like AlkP superfamily enzyme
MEHNSVALIFHAFCTGLRFDIVITGYILFFPFFALIIVDMVSPRSVWLVKIIFHIIFVLFALAFLILAIDIPYFLYFFNRLSNAVFQWMGTPSFVFKMIFQEIRFWGYLIPLILLLLLFYFGLKKSFVSFTHSNRGCIFGNLFLSLCVMGLMVVGIRGGHVRDEPIRIGDAYFCSNPFLNQLGLNPVFTLMKSVLSSDGSNQKRIPIDNKTALQNVQTYFKISDPDEHHPIARHIVPDTFNPAPPNVVLILMESMSAANMQYFGNTQRLTPFLDSIAHESYFFNNIYSAGIHTCHGVFGSLFSFPALSNRRPMEDADITKFCGMTSALKKHGYYTIYFTTHGGQFDNVEAFLKINDVDKVMTQNDYPPEKRVNMWGVSDDFLFEMAVPVIDSLHIQQAPFFATLMTVSNHAPYHIPDYFTSNQTGDKLQIIEYADWSLRKFINMASQRPWFDNTLFIFLADHGAAINPKYELPLSYNHIPFIIYAPKIIPQAQLFDCLGGQIDMFPTVMHLLGLPYINNTFGIDLLKERRPFIYFSADDKWGVINDTFFLMETEYGYERLYRYREEDMTNYIEQNQSLVDEMKIYAQSNMLTSQYLINQRKLSCD